MRLRREPWIVLAPLLLLQWALVPLFAAAVQHNGWLFYHGGDETWYWSTSWTLSQGHLPETAVGYGWSYLLVPFAWLTGPNFLAGLPGVIALQVLVFLPLGTLAIYGAGARLGGRMVGYASALFWVLAPVASIPLFAQNYHDRWVGQFLPQVFGLTGLSEFPSTVAVVVGAYFVLRAMDDGGWVDAGAAGLATGFAVGVKPSNLLFVGAPIVGLALARRWRTLLPFALALAPALLTLALWKQRGLGSVPAISAPEPLRLAAGTFLGDLPATPSGFGRYLNLDWDQLQHNFDGIQEFFWSARFLEWLPVAGALAVARRSVPKAAFLGAWLGAYVLVKGSSPVASVENGSFWRLLMPAFPAFCLLVGAIPLLVPRRGPRLAERWPAALRRLRPSRWLAVPVVVLAVVPLVIAATFSSPKPPLAAKFFAENTYLPLTGEVRVRVAPDAGGGQRIAWTSPSAERTRVFFRVFRSRITAPASQGDPSLPYAHQGLRCLPPSFGPTDCRIEMDLIGTTRAHEWRDVPKPGRWTYRVGLAANWIDDPSFGDTLMLSPPADVTVPRAG